MKCYMCDEDATTREHVPPRSFFPKGIGENLLTVPSCLAHNQSQSRDIEYVRNVIVACYGINDLGEQTFEIARKSFNRSKALFYQTFGDFEAIEFNGVKTGRFRIDLQRMQSVMRPIANAIYYSDYGSRYDAEWKVFVTSLKSLEDFTGQVNQWQPFRNLLVTLQFLDRATPHPTIFKYAVHEMPDGLIFKFEFYGSFTIHCFGPRTVGGI